MEHYPEEWPQVLSAREGRKTPDEPQSLMLELTFKHYATIDKMRGDYACSTFPHPLVTIDWSRTLDDKSGLQQPIRIVAVGAAVWSVADAMTKGGNINDIVKHLEQLLKDRMGEAVRNIS